METLECWPGMGGAVASWSSSGYRPLMIEKLIAEKVEAHYADDKAPLLLLSALGFRLKEDGIWPAAGESRPLRDIVGTTPGLRIIPDPEARSFLAVVRQGDEQRARDEIERRHRLAFLKNLPRPVLLAFTLQLPENEAVHLQLTPRASFVTGNNGAPEGFLPVDPELRMPGLNVDDLRELTQEQIEALGDTIRRWCERHGLDPAALSAHRDNPGMKSISTTKRDVSALDRLLAAQSPDVARRMTIPIDIAVALSRLA